MHDTEPAPAPHMTDEELTATLDTFSKTLVELVTSIARLEQSIRALRPSQHRWYPIYSAPQTPGIVLMGLRDDDSVVRIQLQETAVGVAWLVERDGLFVRDAEGPNLTQWRHLTPEDTGHAPDVERA